MSFLEPPEIEAADRYEVWAQQPRGNWKKFPKVLQTLEDARAFLRAEKNLSRYTKSLKYRIYTVRHVSRREKVE